MGKEGKRDGAPRSEYPRPQLARKDWMCLNGEWEFEIDWSDSGIDRGLKDRSLAERIRVPFCPESRLSGIGCVDFMNAVWYRREVDIPASWAGKKVLLHFQAVDYDATVWVNGTEVMRHRGGFTPFSCDLERVAAPGEKAIIVVRARDLKGQVKPQGKQSPHYGNSGCVYTRTTGIWQTVWMEPVPKVNLGRPRITPDVANHCFRLVQPISNNPKGWKLRVRLLDGLTDGAAGVAAKDEGLAETEIARAEGASDLDLAPQLDLVVPEKRVKLWGPGQPNLYGMSIQLLAPSGAIVDEAHSYAGLRSLGIDGRRVCINGKPVFQRLVLDQGYYPDGIMTAPSDDDLRKDIELSMAAGFNGARLHQKVFEERFLFHADFLGYLCWGEFADWHYSDPNERGAAFPAQWSEALERDFSHPCIVGWCPQNETWQRLEDRITALDDATVAMHRIARLADPTRPVLDSSGYSHRVRGCQIYDSHNYEQDPEKFREQNAGAANGEPFVNSDGGRAVSVPYAGQPYFVSEFGGTWWNPQAKKGEASWGYGERPQEIEQFYARFKGLCDVLLDDPAMFGYCYTQLTDVFQEQNGLLHFDRSPKFDLERIRRIQSRAAAIERQG